MTTPTASELAAITLSSKIPDFWTDQARVWFFRLESMLAPQKLSDEARFDMAVSKLGKDAIQQVTDILMDPPPTNKFATLKTRLLQIYEESQNRQLQKLVSEMELGDQKPSQLLRRMKELAKGKFPDDTLKMMWQGHLPSTIQAVLTVSEVKDLEKLATIADNVFESTRATHQINEVSQPQQSTMNQDTTTILAEIAKLTVKVEELERSRPRYQRRWNNNNYRPRSSSRNRGPENSDRLCFYHHRFQDKAKKCVEPCSWKVSRQGN